MAASIAAAPARNRDFRPELRERMFYPWAGGLLLVLVAMGFQQFYMHGRASDGGPVTEQIVPLVFLHGILMSSWIVFFVVQSSLIARGNRKLHMTVGVSGGVLAAGLVAVGVCTAIASVHFNPASYKDLWGPHRFLTIPLTAILTFGSLVGVGLYYRRRAEVHRPMMFLATLFITTAALFRISAITNPLMSASHASMFIVSWGPMLALGALLGALKMALTRRWDRIYAIGYVAIVVACVLNVLIANTAVWDHVASLVTP